MQASGSVLGIFALTMAASYAIGGVIYEFSSWQGISIYHVSCQGPRCRSTPRFVSLIADLMLSVKCFISEMFCQSGPSFECFVPCSPTRQNLSSQVHQGPNTFALQNMQTPWLCFCTTQQKTLASYLGEACPWKMSIIWLTSNVS